jgi:hypothetical protein
VQHQAGRAHLPGLAGQKGPQGLAVYQLLIGVDLQDPIPAAGGQALVAVKREIILPGGMDQLGFHLKGQPVDRFNVRGHWRIIGVDHHQLINIRGDALQASHKQRSAVFHHHGGADPWGRAEPHPQFRFGAFAHRVIPMAWPTASRAF